MYQLYVQPCTNYKMLIFAHFTDTEAIFDFPKQCGHYITVICTVNISL